MKITSFCDENNQNSWGIIVDHTIYDIPKGSQKLGYGNQYPCVLSLIKSGQSAVEEVQGILEKMQSDGEADWVKNIDNIHWQAPVPLPESIRDYGLFERHILECIREVGLGKLANIDRKIEKMCGGKSLAKRINRAWYERPAYYKGNRFSVVGNQQNIGIPQGCHQFDFELEFGVFINQRGKNISASNARDHIFGVCLLNDFSARDIQMQEMKNRMGPAKGKDFDGGYAMGPYLVTLDEIDDLYDMNFQASVNGKVFGGGNSSEMHWSFEEVIEYTSKDETLHAGEFLGSGTISGKLGPGCGLERNTFLNKGDVVTLDNNILGTLTNTVV